MLVPFKDHQLCAGNLNNYLKDTEIAGIVDAETHQDYIIDCPNTLNTFKTYYKETLDLRVKCSNHQ